MTTARSDQLIAQSRQEFADAISSGQLILYSTPKPAKGAAPGSATELARFNLPNPSGTVDAMGLRLAVPLSALGKANGLAPAWARFVNPTGNFVADFDYAPDVVLSGAITLGGQVLLSSFVIGVPQYQAGLALGLQDMTASCTAQSASVFAFDMPATIVLQQNAPIDLKQYAIGGFQPYSNFRIISGSMQGVSVTPAGILNADSTSVLGALSNLNIALNDAVNDAAQDSAQINIAQQQTLQVYAGEALYLKSIMAVPSGRGRTALNFDATASSPTVMGSGALAGCSMSNGVMFTSITTSGPQPPTWGTPPLQATNCYFRATYGSGPDDLFGPYTIRIDAALPKGLTLYRGATPTTPVNTFARLADLLGQTQPDDIITFEPLMPDGVTQRRYNGMRHAGQLQMANANHNPFGRLTLKSAVPSKRFVIDVSVDCSLTDGKTGQAGSVLTANAFLGAQDLTLEDCELCDAVNVNKDSSEGSVNMKGADTWGLNGQAAFAFSLILRNCFFNGGNSGITSSGVPEYGTPASTDSPRTVTIPPAPYQVSIKPALDAQGGQPYFHWKTGGTSKVTIGGVLATRVTGSPTSQGQYTTTAGADIYTGVITFNAQDTGKQAVITFHSLASHFASDFSSAEIYNSEFRRLGGPSGPCHAMYLNHNADAYLEGCWSHMEGQDGHLVKTKMRATELHACYIDSDIHTPPDIGESDLVDCSVAGKIKLRGCLIVKRPSTDPALAHVFIRIGYEWLSWNMRDGRTVSFECYQCTLVNYDPQCPMFFDYAVPGPQWDGAAFTLSLSNVNQGGSNNKILDCIFAGYNAPSIAGNTTGPLDPAQFGTFFEDAPNNNFRPLSPVGGSSNWATLEYVHPAKTKARTDSFRGAISPNTGPFWATATRIQPGTWYEIDTAAGGNKPSDLNSKTLTPTPGQYDHWKGADAPRTFDDPSAATFWQWSGGTFASAYCPGGAILYRGGGHQTTNSNQINTKVIAWRADTAQFEMAVLPWFEINEVLPGDAANSLNAVEPGFGNPQATLRWGYGGYTAFPFFSATGTCVQSDPDLGKWGEYSFGVPAAAQTYCSTAYLVPCPGMPKGALFLPVLPASTGSGVPAGLRPHWCDLSKGPNAKAQTAWSRFYDRQWQPSPPTAAFCASTANTRVAVAYSIALGSDDGIIVSDARGGVGTQTQGKCNISGLAMYGGDGAQFEFCQHPTDTSGDQDIIMSFTAAGITPKGPVIVQVKNITVGGTAAVTRVTETYQGNPGRPQDPTKPGSGMPVQWCGFTYCVDLDCIFMLSVGSASGPWPGDPRGVVLWKMQFPANRVTGTYVWTSEVLTRSTYQAGRPDDPHDWVFNGQTPPSAGMYTKLRYLPAVKCLAYCHQMSGFMRVFKPAGL